MSKQKLRKWSRNSERLLSATTLKNDKKNIKRNNEAPLEFVLFRAEIRFVVIVKLRNL